MLLCIEFILAAAAVGAGVLLFMAGLRRRPTVKIRPNVDASDDNVIATNFYCLAIIGLLFFGTCFLIDVAT